jgi:hypothetical protein
LTFSSAHGVYPTYRLDITITIYLVGVSIAGIVGMAGILVIAVGWSLIRCALNYTQTIPPTTRYS